MFSSIISFYDDLKKSNLIEKEPIISHYYFQFFQHYFPKAALFTDAITFLEAMYTKNCKNYVKMRLRLNAASFLAKNNQDYTKINHFMRDLYDIRSSIVHGSDWLNKFNTFLRKTYNSTEIGYGEANRRFMKNIKHYITLSLKYFIEEVNKNATNLSQINTNPLYFFNNSQLAKSGDLRRKIIQELKYNYTNNKYEYKDRWEEFNDLFKLSKEF
jgi:hypothetical protein